MTKQNFPASQKAVNVFIAQITLESPLVTICTTYLTLNNSTFCPHSVFIWIWEQTAIISLYNINWLVFYKRDEECLLRGTSL